MIEIISKLLAVDVFDMLCMAALAGFRLALEPFFGTRFPTFHRTGGFASCLVELGGFASSLRGLRPGEEGEWFPPVALANAVINWVRTTYKLTLEHVRLTIVYHTIFILIVKYSVYALNGLCMIV